MYTRATRLDWFEREYPRIERNKVPYRQIAWEIKNFFDLDKPPSLATIQRDKAEIEKRIGPNTMSDEAKELLKPENFPEWRNRLFGYVTSKTQHALFYMLWGLALKEPIPDWVCEHFELPRDVMDDVIEAEKLMTFILMMAPRHGKTMTMVHGLINLYCDNPDLRVVYCQGIKSTTEDINRLIMLEMEDNDELETMYGPFRHDDRTWSFRDGFILAKRKKHSITPSFLPVGINSNVRSRDADILVIDDPQDLQRAESEATTEMDYKKITSEFMTRREPHTPVLMVGSHLPTLFGDVFTQLEDNLEDLQTEGQVIYFNKRPAHRDDKCLVHEDPTKEHDVCLEWPEYRDWNFLMAQRALLGEELYEAVYQQDNKVEGTRPFSPEKIKAWLHEGGVRDDSRSWKKMLRRCERTIDGKICNGDLYAGLGFDPAAGESKNASYTAVALIQGCIKCEMLYLIDYEQRRMSPDLHPGVIESWSSSYPIHLARIEINAYQKALARNKEVREASRKNKFQIDEWNTDDRKNTPEFGIPLLANYVRDGLFSMPYAKDVDQEFAREFEKAMIRYPKKPNDIPMAVWLAAGAVWMLWTMYTDLDPIYLRHRDRNVPGYMIDNPLKINLGDLAERQRWEESEEYYALEDVG